MLREFLRCPTRTRTLKNGTKNRCVTITPWDNMLFRMAQKYTKNVENQNFLEENQEKIKFLIVHRLFVVEFYVYQYPMQ